MTLTATIKRHYALWAGMAAMTIVAVLIVAKTLAYIESGSVSVLASLIDSMMDAAISLMSFMAIRYSLKPADHEHRYGHGKIEGLAAMFQAALIFAGGAFVIFESFRNFARPSEDDHGFAAFAVMALSLALSLVLVLIQRFSLRYAPSLAVEADKANYSGDIAVSAGVIVVLVALYLGAPHWIDPLFAVCVAIYLARTARGIALKALDMLLDRELPEASRNEILAVIRSHPAVRGVHDLRTRKAGMDVHIAFDIELDPEQSLRQAHEVVIALEHELLKRFPHAEIMIHKDPAGIPHVDRRHQVAGVHDR